MWKCAMLNSRTLKNFVFADWIIKTDGSEWKYLLEMQGFWCLNYPIIIAFQNTTCSEVHVLNFDDLKSSSLDERFF